CGSSFCSVVEIRAYPIRAMKIALSVFLSINQLVRLPVVKPYWRTERVVPPNERFTDLGQKRVFYGTATNIDGKFLVSADGTTLEGSRSRDVLHAHPG
ncbi:hypothetical protein, partial [Sulfitobacter sp. HI0021]|uniref:hypothetical protein n=1 Tax=Sulfitobacter sp. HI0021 TaxID=1822224 RepID=UPI001F2F6652